MKTQTNKVIGLLKTKKTRKKKEKKKNKQAHPGFYFGAEIGTFVMDSLLTVFTFKAFTNLNGFSEQI